ncbi:MAG: 5-oxoprolinase subunit PxpA [Acidobacteriota bacterium]
MRTVDLNCDMGEGCLNDAELMEFVTSVNIACGSHAGDAETMRATVELAKAKNIAIGSHPSFPDRVNFGRSIMSLQPSEIYTAVRQQTLTLMNVCEDARTVLDHVKPHGALYNLSARDRATAAAIAASVRDVDASLILFGLAGSLSISEAERAGLRTASEAFADRTYQPDGSLTPRDHDDALITGAADAAAQALSIVWDRRAFATDGAKVAIMADTICIHGDGPNAVDLARTIHDTLLSHNINISRLNG